MPQAGLASGRPPGRGGRRGDAATRAGGTPGPRTRRAALGFVALLALAGFAHDARAAEPLYVVVSARNPAKALTHKDVIAIFTGRSRTLPDGTPVQPLDQAHDGPVRAAFYLALTGQDIARINSYWARLHFTAQLRPPQALADDEAVTARLRADEGAIGYVSRKPADAALRVVLQLPLGPAAPASAPQPP